MKWKQALTEGFGLPVWAIKPSACFFLFISEKEDYMEKSILSMLEELEPVREAAEEAAKEADNAPSSAAERLGRAMLSRLGAIEGLGEDELVDALLENWGKLPEPEDDGEEEPEENELPEFPAEEIFEARSRRPVPMRTGSMAAERVDYSDMSAKQFAELKKLLKRASADGRKIKL